VWKKGRVVKDSSLRFRFVTDIFVIPCPNAADNGDNDTTYTVGVIVLSGHTTREAFRFRFVVCEFRYREIGILFRAVRTFIFEQRSGVVFSTKNLL